MLIVFHEFTHVVGHLTFACWGAWRDVQPWPTNGADRDVKCATAHSVPLKILHLIVARLLHTILSSQSQ